jgi:hypothetical protein
MRMKYLSGLAAAGWMVAVAPSASPQPDWIGEEIPAGEGEPIEDSSMPFVETPPPGADRFLRLDGGVLAGPLSLPAGGLTVGGSQLVVRDGRVGIGTDDPQADLDVAGTLRLGGGDPGEGKLLVSDHRGRARWASPEALALTTGPQAAAAVQFGTVFGPLQQQPLNLQVAGRRALRLEPNMLSPNLIGGLDVNTVLPHTVGATISGGGHPREPNRVDADFGVVGGGAGNRVEAPYATVGGGWDNQADGVRATVAGGRLNRASGAAAAVGGGFTNRAESGYATIGGGYANRVGGYVATVAGGWGNQATGTVSSIGGGQDNLAQDAGTTVAGGWQNRAAGQGSAIGGGTANETTGELATIAGGSGNAATGFHAAVPGGAMNTAAGEYSLAAGRRARAAHPGSFVWGDGTDTEITSTAPHQFVVQASGGIHFLSDPEARTGVSLPPGSGSWTTLSDRDSKENFEPVDSERVLRAVAALPVHTWNYIAEGDGIRHLGPTGQDFHAAFRLGRDERGIAEVDAAGVALAAIQALHRQVQERTAQIQHLEQSNRELARRLLDIEQRLSKEDDDAPRPDPEP